MYADSESSLFACFLNFLLNFFLCFFNHFFDTGRMNTTIVNQFFQSNAGNFTTNRIKAGNNNSFRSIVDNQVDTGQSFQSADVTTFTTDNTAFHFIIGQTYNRNSSFCNMVSGTTLDSQRNNLASFLISLILCLLLQILNQHCGLMFNLVLQRLQKLLFSFVTGQAGQTLQLCQLLFT